jgi:excisionase family DNA binding protein
VTVPTPAGSTEDVDLTTAAGRLGVHYQTAYQWVRDGSLPAARVRNRYRVQVSELEALARRREQPEPVPERRRPTDWPRLAGRLERHLLAGDETRARDQVVGLRGDGVPLKELIGELFVPALRAIGAGWVAGRVSIPEEHRATAIVERILGELAPRPRGRRRGRAVVAALSGDRHGLPTAMAAAVLREDHWHVEHLGADMPPEDVLQFATAAGADLVVLSVTVGEHAGAAEETARRLAGAGIPAVVGGPSRTLDELLAEARAQAPAARAGA